MSIESEKGACYKVHADKIDSPLKVSFVFVTAFIGKFELIIGRLISAYFLFTKNPSFHVFPFLENVDMESINPSL